MKKYVIAVVLIFMIFNLKAKDYTVTSPSGNLTVKISVNEDISYTVLLNGAEIIAPSKISMTLENEILGKNAKVQKAKTVSVNSEITPVVQRKYSKIADVYQLLTLSFKNYSLHFRAYDEGVAYRWEVTAKAPFKVVSEQATFTFPSDYNIWFPEEESMFSHQERSYKYVKLSEITPERFGSTGMLVNCANNVKVYISESALIDYPGMFLQGSAENKNALSGKFAGVVLETKQLTDRDVAPVK
ncbi:MAG: glycoside hydrolase family 97 protein, partial [Bacteroidia bacterium]|nr:glycoside hydrolase family 97 protein [Bacteroidia bacterium]